SGWPACPRAPSSRSRPSSPSRGRLNAAARTRKTGAAGSAPDRASALERKFHKLGLREPVDFIVHLPLRYEDETRITPIAQARSGQHVVLEGEIIHSELLQRPRRQLQAVLEDGSGRIGLRWLHVYPGQQARVSAGRRLRARGEVRAGFGGPEIVHPLIS